MVIKLVNEVLIIVIMVVNIKVLMVELINYIMV